MESLVAVSQGLQHNNDRLKAENLKQIQAAEADTSVLWKRIEELESCKSTLEVDLMFKQATIESLVAASQGLQHNNDQLKEQCDRQAAATFTTVEEKQQEIDRALNSNRALAKSLAAAQSLAEFYQSRMEDLTFALEETPNEIANTKGVIEQKDSMFCDLEMRAGQLFTSFTALEIRSGEEKDIARQEIATLRAELKRFETTVTVLQRSRDGFKQKFKADFEKLKTEAGRDDVINAMNDIFQTVTQDNSKLQTEIERQASELSSADLKLSSLEKAMQEVQRSLTAKAVSYDELQSTLTTKDVELGKLQWYLDIQKGIHQSAIDEKDRRLEDADRELREAHDSTVELMNKELGERERQFIKGKDDQIEALKEKCRALSSSVKCLKRDLRINSSLRAENATAASERMVEAEDALVKLKDAQDQIEKQQEQFREFYKLPASLNITEVLAMKIALGEAQVKIEQLEEQLEHQLQIAEEAAAQNPEPPFVDDDEPHGISDLERSERDEKNDDGDEVVYVDENTY